MDKARRVGVIEIGSRAIRLLVSDVSPVIGVRMVTTAVEPSDLSDINESDLTTAQRIVKQVFHSVQALRARAGQSDAESVVVVGTEALRGMAGTDIYESSELAGAVDVVLDSRSEALYSLIAGSVSLGRNARESVSRFVMLDQGFGSMEIAWGKPGPPVMLEGCVSTELGVGNLLRQFASRRSDLRALRSDVSRRLVDMKIPRPRVDRAVVLGSVATKCAWLVQRRDKGDRYNPRMVEGTRLEVEFLKKFWTTFSQTVESGDSRAVWAEMGKFVEPNGRSDEEGRRVMVGILPIVHVMEHFGQDSFVVCSLGTRHGLAYQIGLDPSSFSRCLR